MAVADPFPPNVARPLSHPLPPYCACCGRMPALTLAHDLAMCRDCAWRVVAALDAAEHRADVAANRHA